MLLGIWEVYFMMSLEGIILAIELPILLLLCILLRSR